MGAIHIDDSRHPLVIVTFTGVATDAEFETYLDEMKRNLERRRPTAMVLDATNAGSTPPTHRRRQAEWLKEHEALLKQYSAGTAFVITSPLVRGALTAILWVQPMPASHTVVATRHEAEKWAIEQLTRRGERVAKL